MAETPEGLAGVEAVDPTALQALVTGATAVLAPLHRGRTGR